MTNNRNLTPTRVLRKDGHMTTVHKKSDAGSASSGRLAGIAPQLSPAPKKVPFESKKVTAKWETHNPKLQWEANDADKSEYGGDYYRGKSYLRVGPKSHLARMGANWKSVGKDGSIKMAQGEMYDYLREGISLPEAAALHSQDPSPARWMERGNANGALPGPLSYEQYGDKARLVSIKNAVDALRAHEISPSTAQRLLRNGFNDDHINGVLNMDQLVELFDRFKYQASVNDGVDTNASATLDALIDGRLPYELFEGKYKRTSLTSALDALYPAKRQGALRRDTSLDDEGREYLKNNPQEITHVVAAMESGQRKSSFGDAYQSVRLFGVEASIEYSPGLLMMKREDGSHIGVSGAIIARDFRDYCERLLGDDKNVIVGGYGNNIQVYDRPIGAWSAKPESGYNQIVEMREAGASNEQILDLIYTQRLNGAQALAVIKGDSVPSLGPGWL